jgi:hypothetical protein
MDETGALNRARAEPNSRSPQNDVRNNLTDVSYARSGRFGVTSHLSRALQPVSQRLRHQIKHVRPSQRPECEEVLRKEHRISLRHCHFRHRLHKRRKVIRPCPAVRKAKQQVIVAFPVDRSQRNHCRLPECGLVAARRPLSPHSASAQHDVCGTNGAPES